MAIPSDWSIKFIGVNDALTGTSDVRAICPHCKNASIFSVRTQLFIPELGSNEVHLVLQCNYAHCRKATYVRTNVRHGRLTLTSQDSFFMYPSGLIEPAHSSIPPQVSEDWIEAQNAVQASAPKAAAVMFRRVLYGVLIDKKCKLQPLREGLAELIKGQRLPAIFDDWLPAIRDDGHDAAHPDRALQVSPDNLAETMMYTAELLRFLYIEPYEFQKRKDRQATSTDQCPANTSTAEIPA